MKRLMGLFAVLVIALAACGAGPKAITQGTIRDSIFSVEPRQNGTVSIWMTHDDRGVYCTADTALGAKAAQIIKSDNPNVLVTFRSINGGDDEVTYFLNPASGCGDGRKDTVQYKLLNIEQVK